LRLSPLLVCDFVVSQEANLENRTLPLVGARGRDYYTPYRSMLPREVEGLLVAGRHYSATESAQKMSREIPPCMSMGQAAGVAAAIAAQSGTALRHIDPRAICLHVRAQGGDPGDVPSANAKILEKAA
jgi:hypothetical protein